MPSKTRTRADPWLRQVGENIRRERKAAGLTQEKLAEKADLSARVYQRIEAGQMNFLVSTLRRIRRAIGCQFQALLDE